MPQGPRKFKVVLLGEGRVGKTSLLVRYVKNQFDDREQATVQAIPFHPRTLKVGTEQVELSLWDTAGQERFHSLGPIYYRDAQAALLVFDITDLDSFERVKAWVKELRQMVGPDIILTIAANKSDLESQRSVSQDVIASYASEVGAEFFSTSAKTGAGLDMAFRDIAKRILEQQHDKNARMASLQSSGSLMRQRRHGGIVIADESQASVSHQSSCC